MEREISRELGRSIGVDVIGVVARRSTVTWHGSMEQKREAGWVKADSMLVVDVTAFVRR